MSVHPDELTGSEQAVLLVLMAECRPVPNARLKDLGPDLTKAQRENLQRKELIEVRGKPMVVELTDRGWRMCRAIVGTDAPSGVTGQKKALYTVMKSLGRYFDRADLAPGDVFLPAEQTETAGRPDVPTLVRRAYDGLAAKPGAWVGLRRLRDALPDVSRADVDRELLRLYQDPEVSLIPEENQKTLTDDDHAAAVRIGNKDNHVIAIHS